MVGVSGSSIPRSEISSAPLFQKLSHDDARRRSCCDSPSSELLIQRWRKGDAHPRSERQGGGAGIADPLTISRSAATLSDAWVGRAGGEVQADPEPADLGTL
jgi:hypothetical protein